MGPILAFPTSFAGAIQSFRAGFGPIAAHFSNRIANPIGCGGSRSSASDRILLRAEFLPLDEPTFPNLSHPLSTTRTAELRRSRPDTRGTKRDAINQVSENKSNLIRDPGRGSPGSPCPRGRRSHISPLARTVHDSPCHLVSRSDYEARPPQSVCSKLSAGKDDKP